MKDIQEIMTEMETLDKEIAATNQEETETKESCSGCGQKGSENRYCPKINPYVKLCCTTVVKTFKVNETALADPKNLTFIYDPNCLNAIVEEIQVPICDGCSECTAYFVKIVGCIPFAFSARKVLSGTYNNKPTCPTGAFSDVCCQCCICVDKYVACYPTRREAEHAIPGIVATIKACSASIMGPAAELVHCETKGGPHCNCLLHKCKNETYVKFEATLNLLPAPPCASDKVK